MKIRTRVKITATLAFCVILGYGTWAVYCNRTMGRMTREMMESQEVINRIYMLRALTNDFLSFPSERAQRQWQTLYEELLRLLDDPAYRELLGNYGVTDLTGKLKTVADTFARLRMLRENSGQNSSETETGKDLHNRLATQLLLASQDMITRTSRMIEEIQEKLIIAQRVESFFDMLALLTFGLIIISAGVFLQRSVIRPVLKLHEGAEIIGAGNLSYQVGMNTRDEIGQLSQAFDRMTANLQQITVSRDELVQEIEERKRAEEALRESREDLKRAQTVAHIGNWRLDTRKNQLYWSDETYRIFGIPPGAPLTYESFLATVHPEDREYVDRKWTAALAGEPYDIEHRIVVGDEVKWVCEQAELELNPRGELLGGFGTVQDITRRKQAEEKLRETLLDLERSNRDLEDFAYISSHDLQEPLRKIANFSEMLVREYRDRLDERGVRYFGYVIDGAQRMQGLINALLSYSRVGRANSPLIPADLENVLRGTLADLQELIRESRAEISHDFLPIVKVNPYQIGQILQNLIVNAIKFHGGQPPRIHLSARQEGHEWVIAVRDNGIGFDSRFAEQIFKVFKRLHPQEQYPGTGIGLAICKRIVERHGGRIWAESEPGIGSTFFFTIPV